MLEAYEHLLVRQTTARAKRKAAQQDLDQKIDAKYSTLTEAEVKALVIDDKWMTHLSAAVQGEVDRVSQTLTGRVRQLAERYAKTACRSLPTKWSHLALESESISPRVGAGMEVKPGYRQTEVGVIPEDWKLVAIGSLASFSSGQGIDIASLTEESSDRPIPVYGGNGIAGYTALALTSEPTVVVGRVGQKCGEVYLTEGPAWVTDNALYPRRFRDQPHIPFLALAMQAAGLNNVKNRNDLPLITQSILHSARVPIPPTEAEQRAIADALRDVDALLVGLDRLISKKDELRRAVMQKLLTGRTRLPRFNGEWKLVELDAVCSMKSGEGITAASIDQFSAYPGAMEATIFRGYTSRFTHDGTFALIGRQGALCGNVIGLHGEVFRIGACRCCATAKPGTDIGFLTYVLGEMHLNRFSEIPRLQPGLSVAISLEVAGGGPTNWEPNRRASRGRPLGHGR